MQVPTIEVAVMLRICLPSVEFWSNKQWELTTWVFHPVCTMAAFLLYWLTVARECHPLLAQCILLHSVVTEALSLM